MKKSLLIFLTSFLFSCANTSRITVGKFYGKSYSIGGEITLSLNSNQSFKMRWRNLDYYGKWEQVDHDHILLKYNKITDLLYFLQSGTIRDSVKEIRFINKNKIKIDGYYILKRQNKKNKSHFID